MTADLLAALRRPYRVSIPMLVLVSLVPFYIFIPELMPRRTLHAPELALDRALPLVPSWAIIYGALYFFLIVLPVLVVREEAHIRRTVYAYLTIWITAYVFFIVYPTVAPRPASVAGSGFAAWGLRALYGADPPYNCFPSLHVAHSFVSALTCLRVHRGVGVTAIVCAVCVALSTLFTKQHYVLDVAAGIVLALLSYAIFLRRLGRAPELDRRAAPMLAASVALLAAIGVAGFYIFYAAAVPLRS